jgi:hypothetical protein
MRWQKVEFRDGDASALSATSLIHRFTADYQAGGMPPGVRVYHGTSGTDHVYYFSPEAWSLAEQTLRSFGAVSCDSQPEVQGLTLVSI